MGDFVEVSSPILAGVAGAVHIGMDTGLIALKIQRAVGQQVYLISSIFIIGIFSAIWLIRLAARPIDSVIAYAARLAREQKVETSDDKLLSRDDEVGQLARLFLYFSMVMDFDKAQGTPRANMPSPDPQAD